MAHGLFFQDPRARLRGGERRVSKGVPSRISMPLVGQPIIRLVLECWQRRCELGSHSSSGHRTSAPPGMNARLHWRNDPQRVSTGGQGPPGTLCRGTGALDWECEEPGGNWRRLTR
ncbi:hypothetical protein KM043_003548 [Ampulex compressa]|nr:hypothetical protein KM043_003548 [Ampulex compressa]